MSKGLYLLLCVAIFAALCCVNIAVNRPRIERDLTARTWYTLKDQVDVLDVQYEGRDGLVVIGTDEPRAKEMVRLTTEAVWGVRVAEIKSRKIERPELDAARDGVSLAISGRYPNDETKRAFEENAKNAFGPANVKGTLAADPKIFKRPYLPGLLPYVMLLKNAPADLKMSLRDDVLTLSGTLPTDAQRAAVESKARELLPKGVSLVLSFDVVVRVTAAEPPVIPTPVGDPLKDILAKLHILFGFDKSDVLPGSLEDVAKAAQALKNFPTRRVLVLGYTDSRGSDAYNIKLGGRRADTVVRLLTKAGIAAERMETVPRGKQDYVADNVTPEGQQQNRRVQFVTRPAEGG